MTEKFSTAICRHNMKVHAKGLRCQQNMSFYTIHTTNTCAQQGHQTMQEQSNHVYQTGLELRTSPNAPFPIIVNSSKSSAPILCL